MDKLFLINTNLMNYSLKVSVVFITITPAPPINPYLFVLDKDRSTFTYLIVVRSNPTEGGISKGAVYVPNSVWRTGVH